MKKMFLASSIDITGPSIGKKIADNLSELKLAFISTGAEVEGGPKSWLKNDRKGLQKAGFNLTDYSLTDKTIKDLENDLADFDVIHLNGGNTFYLLQQVKKSGFDKWIIEAIGRGVIYTSSSAGTHIASKNIQHVRFVDDPKFAPELDSYDALNLIDARFVVHWGSIFNSEKREESLKYMEENPPILLSNYQYVEVKDDMYKIVDIRENNKNEN